MLQDINNTTQDISARLNVVETKVGTLQNINSTTQDIVNTTQYIKSSTQDISARLNVVETKVGTGGDSCGGGDGAPTAAALEQIRTVLRQQG